MFFVEAVLVEWTTLTGHTYCRYRRQQHRNFQMQSQSVLCSRYQYQKKGARARARTGQGQGYTRRKSKHDIDSSLNICLNVSLHSHCNQPLQHCNSALTPEPTMHTMSHSTSSLLIRRCEKKKNWTVPGLTSCSQDCAGLPGHEASHGDRKSVV